VAAVMRITAQRRDRQAEKKGGFFSKAEFGFSKMRVAAVMRAEARQTGRKERYRKEIYVVYWKEKKEVCPWKARGVPLAATALQRSLLPKERRGELGGGGVELD